MGKGKDGKRERVMNRAEARAILESMKLIDFRFAPKSKAIEALDLAIEALREELQLSGETSTISEKESVVGVAESATTTDCISRADTIKAMCRECKVFPDDVVNCADCTEVAIVKGMPSCNQTCNQKQVTGKLKNPDDSLLKADSEACKEQKSKLDCISRQQAIEAIEKEIGRIRENPCAIATEGDFYYQNALKLAQEIIELQPPVTPTDKIVDFNNMISADDRIRNLPPVNQKQITGKLESAEIATSEGEESTMDQPKSKLEPCGLDWCPYMDDNGNKYCTNCIYRNRKPPVTPTERTGEWVRKQVTVDDIQFTGEECSNCNFWKNMGTWNYCPNCGAKMEGGEEE